MRLYAKRCAIESWAHADVGDGAAALCFAVEQRARDVDAAGREKFLFRHKIESGNGKTVTHARARNNFTGENKRPSEQAAGMGYFAIGYFAPDHGAADNFAMIDNRRDDNYFETMTRAEFFKQRGAARLFMAEAKIFADKERTNTKLLDEDLLNEILGR